MRPARSRDGSTGYGLSAGVSAASFRAAASSASSVCCPTVTTEASSANCAASVASAMFALFASELPLTILSWVSLGSLEKPPDAEVWLVVLTQYLLYFSFIRALNFLAYVISGPVKPFTSFSNSTAEAAILSYESAVGLSGVGPLPAILALFRK